jgi:hypothetical protein
MEPDYQGFPEAGGAAGTGAACARVVERRAHPRYNLVVEFELFHLRGAKRLTWAGTSQTRNWSRNSILIDWDQPLVPNTSVELVVRWSPGVQLVVIGRVMHTEARGTVIRILRRRFRGKPEFADAKHPARLTTRRTGEPSHAC